MSKVRERWRRFSGLDESVKIGSATEFQCFFPLFKAFHVGRTLGSSHLNECNFIAFHCGVMSVFCFSFHHLCGLNERETT